MSEEPIGDVEDDRSADFEEARHHLPPVVDHLDEKFADAGREHVADIVEEVFTDLSSGATVPNHLPALTQHHAQERLRAETGETAHPQQ